MAKKGSETIVTTGDEIVFSVSDPEGILIRLYEEQWQHIKKHPEIRPVRKLRDCVAKPDIIQLNEERNTRIYLTSTSINLYFSVYAAITSETEGRVRTAYLRNDLPEGDCIWRRSKK